MQLPRGNPRLPDRINNRDQKPLQDFLILAAGVMLGIFLLSVLLLKSAQWLAPHLPYEWERDWFGADWSAAADAAPATESDSRAKEAALTALMARLLSSQPDALPVTLHWLNQDDPNAFAVVGGHIFVTRGLLQQVSSENALAMVLAHEYAHVQLRHPITLAAEQLSLTTLNLLLGDTTASALTQQGGWLALLSYSRDMERAADRQALAILRSYYGHTAGAGEFFQRMQEEHDDSAWQAMFRTHQLTQERLDVINRQPASSGAQLTPLAPVFNAPQG